LRRREDVERLEAPGLRELVLGTYCSVGRWTEPNNHVLNSFLINLTLPACRPAEAAVRIPALVAGVVFAALATCLCWRVFPARTATFLVAVVAFWHPYLLQYSKEARGYSWMLALQLFMILGFIRLARSPASLTWGVLTAGAAALMVINVVSTSLDWVLPAYLVMFVAAGSLAAQRAPNPGARPGTTLRKCLAVQAVAIGAVGLVFLMDRLPYVYSSARQYGVPFRDFGGFMAELRETAGFLFPTVGWQLFAAAGLLGLLLSFRHREQSLGSHVLRLAPR
jgi:hypothetical protein